MENTNQLVLTAEILELKIGKKELGALTTNALDIKALVEKILPNYDIANYNESNIDMAKKDKALLNASAKALNDKRIEIEKEWMIPFNEFKDIVTDTCKLIKSATEQIDIVVKESEAKEKESKKAQIVTFWQSKDFKLVTLEKIFDEKWLNKTFKIKDVQIEINSRIAKISDDIITIEAIGTDIDLLKSLYLDTLNLNSTIQYANTLKANRETAQKEAESRNNSAPANEIEEVVAETPSNVNVDDEEVLVRYVKITAPKSKLLELTKYMNDKGIQFEKLDYVEA